MYIYKEDIYIYKEHIYIRIQHTYRHKCIYIYKELTCIHIKNTHVCIAHTMVSSKSPGLNERCRTHTPRQAPVTNCDVSSDQREDSIDIVQLACMRVCVCVSVCVCACVCVCVCVCNISPGSPT